MNEFQKKITCKDEIYRRTEFVCQIAELKQVNKTSDSFSVFGIQRDNMTILCNVSNDGTIKTKCIKW